MTKFKYPIITRNTPSLATDVLPNKRKKLWVGIYSAVSGSFSYFFINIYLLPYMGNAPENSTPCSQTVRQNRDGQLS